MTTLPEHISYSSLNTWMDCGWRYKLEKVDKVQQGHAVYFTGGSAVHKATELYDLGMEGTAEDIWNKAWFDTVAEDEAINGDMNTWAYVKREDMSWWYGEGLWMLDRWINFRKNWTPLEGYIEKEFEIRVNDTLVRGAIDRVMVDKDGNNVLLDIKTGANSQRHPLQLAKYKWACEVAGIRIDRAGFWDARKGVIDFWNLEHLNTPRVEEIFTTFDKARKADIFLPNLSQCGRCSVVAYCKWMNGRYTREEETNG